MHPLAVYFLFIPLAAQADLYKCTDDTGKITYTNSTCAKVGLKQSKVIPPPPPPVLGRPARKTEEVKPVVEKTIGNRGKETVALQVVKSAPTNSAKCAKLNADMGRILDEMDAARHGGNAGPDDRQDAELKKLQTDKNRLGCF